MLSRIHIARNLRPQKLPLHRVCLSVRYFAAKNNNNAPAKLVVKPQAEPGWLTRKVESSPGAKRVFLAVAKMMGYGSPKQIAGMQSFAFYENVCAVMPDNSRDFWQSECALPPTFQSWFTVTNLHVWMLTVRLRALPPSHARFYQQALLDHFFLDIEDRIRTVLQPPATPTNPYTFTTTFYVNPPGAIGKDGKPKARSRAPDSLVSRQMKIFKEQWAGMNISFDLGLVRNDMELAAAVWRNLLGARGAAGIAYPTGNDAQSASAPFRRAVNLVGGEVVNVAKVDWEKEATQDDKSGVHDFAPAEIDRYLEYPHTMARIVTYVRRELKRLESISDEDILAGNWKNLKFGKIPERV